MINHVQIRRSKKKAGQAVLEAEHDYQYVAIYVSDMVTIPAEEVASIIKSLYEICKESFDNDMEEGESGETYIFHNGDSTSVNTFRTAFVRIMNMLLVNEIKDTRIWSCEIEKDADEFITYWASVDFEKGEGYEEHLPPFATEVYNAITDSKLRAVFVTSYANELYYMNHNVSRLGLIPEDHPLNSPWWSEECSIGKQGDDVMILMRGFEDTKIENAVWSEKWSAIRPQIGKMLSGSLKF